MSRSAPASTSMERFVTLRPTLIVPSPATAAANPTRVPTPQCEKREAIVAPKTPRKMIDPRITYAVVTAITDLGGPMVPSNRAPPPSASMVPTKHTLPPGRDSDNGLSDGLNCVRRVTKTSFPTTWPSGLPPLDALERGPSGNNDCRSTSLRPSGDLEESPVNFVESCRDPRTRPTSQLRRLVEALGTLKGEWPGKSGWVLRCRRI